MPVEREHPAEAAQHAFADSLVAHYRANLPRLVRRALLWCDGRADAEDLVQEAFARVYAAYVDSDRPPPAEAAIPRLLNVSIRRLAIDLLRSRAVRGGTAASAADDDDGGGNGHESTDDPAEARDERTAEDVALQPDPLPDPEEAAAARQTLARMIDRLPAKTALVLQMVWEGSSPVEIGAAFGRNGYTLRRVARERACKALAELAALGDAMAASIFAVHCPQKLR